VNRFLASLSAALLAGMVALDVGLPVWRHWPVGDASDFAITTFWAVWFGIAALRPRGEIA